jgi:hypothetical protein
MKLSPPGLQQTHGWARGQRWAFADAPVTFTTEAAPDLPAAIVLVKPASS